MRKPASSTPAIILKKGSKNARIIVSNKVAKKAVDRNRIKRIIREANRIGGVKDYTIIVKENIANLKTREVLKLLETQIKKI